MYACTDTLHTPTYYYMHAFNFWRAIVVIPQHACLASAVPPVHGDRQPPWGSLQHACLASAVHPGQGALLSPSYSPSFAFSPHSSHLYSGVSPSALFYTLLLAESSSRFVPVHFHVHEVMYILLQISGNALQVFFFHLASSDQFADESMLVLVIDIANQMISDPCVRNKVAFHSHVRAAAFDVTPSCSCTPSFLAQQW